MSAPTTPANHYRGIWAPNAFNCPHGAAHSLSRLPKKAISSSPLAPICIILGRLPSITLFSPNHGPQPLLSLGPERVRLREARHVHCTRLGCTNCIGRRMYVPGLLCKRRSRVADIASPPGQRVATSAWRQTLPSCLRPQVGSSSPDSGYPSTPLDKILDRIDAPRRDWRALGLPSASSRNGRRARRDVSSAPCNHLLNRISPASGMIDLKFKRLSRDNPSHRFERELAAIEDHMFNCRQLLSWFVRRRDEAQDLSERQEFDRRIQIIQSELGEIDQRLQRIKISVNASVGWSGN